MKIAYIIDTFPRPSERFITREILELKKSGIDIRIFAMKRCSGQAAISEFQSLVDDTLFLSHLSARQKFSSLIRVLFRRADIFFQLPFLLIGDIFTADRHAGKVKISDIIRFFYHRIRGAVYAMAIAEFADFDYDHIHAHFAYVTTDIASVLAYHTGCSWSVSAHAADIFTQSGAILFRRVESADRIFVCSRYAEEVLKRKLKAYITCRGEGKHKADILTERIVLMYHGIDLGKFEGEKAADYILSVGRLEEKKGFTYLLDAAKIVQDRNIKISFKIAGDGVLREALEKKARELSLENVEFTGFLPFFEVRTLMESAVSLLQPSVVAGDGNCDGIPNVIIEAMALKKPVISTIVGGIPELLHDGENGILLDSATPLKIADAVEEIVSNGKKAEKMGSNGRETVSEKFDISKNTEKMKRYFTAVID